MCDKIFLDLFILTNLIKIEKVIELLTNQVVICVKCLCPYLVNYMMTIQKE